MGLVLDYVKVYPPIEQYCHENDLIGEIKVHRDDNNPPHIVYSLNGNKNEDPVYGYVNINNNNGKIYLTIDGVNAINQDYPDNPNKEIKELKFQVLAKDSELGDTLTTEVQIGVVRIHDEPPKIIDKVIYDIYQEDSKENERVLDIRTAFPSFFYTTSNLVKIPEADIGRVVLSSDGVDYVKNIVFDNPNVTKSLDFSITIQDQQNSLTLVKNFQIPIKPGKALDQIPKKSILEEIGANLGQDLAKKIETNRLKIEHEKFLNDLIFNEQIDYSSDINTSTFDSFYGKAIAELIFKNKDDSDSSNSNSSDTILNHIDYAYNKFINTISYIQQKSINDTINNFNENIYNTLSKNDIDIASINTNNYIFNDQPYLNLIYESFLEAVKYSKDYINDALEYVSKAIVDVANNLDNLIFKLGIDLVNFKHKEYCDFKKDTSDRLSTLESLVTNIRKEICGESDNLFGQGCYSDSDTPIKTRLDTDEANIAKNTSDISSINNKSLEDWGTDTAWKFTSTTSTSGTLEHGGTTVINRSSSTDLYIGTSTFSNVKIVASTATATFDSNGLNLGSNTLTANLCDCTATKAKYADIAEYYDSDKIYEIGTIMAVGGEKEVTSFSKLNNNLIGIISDKPGFILNSDTKFEIPALIGLKGRIKVKSKEFIKKGSRVYASLINDGFATVKENKYLIGYALKDSEMQNNENYLTLIYFKGI
jgi:hypothetical protein